jgi:hypothetical protein
MRALSEQPMNELRNLGGTGKDHSAYAWITDYLCAHSFPAPGQKLQCRDRDTGLM